MSKREQCFVTLAAGLACPLLTFTAFWWTAAAIHLYAFPLPVGLIRAAALAGLGLGCLLDVLCLRLWVKKFFTANPRWLLAAYLGLFVIAFGFFMGLPVGTFLLGIVAGIYVGRREFHRQADAARAAAAFRRVAVFVASVTTAAALAIGILALQSEQETLRWLENTFGLNQNSLQGGGGFVLIGLLCVLLFVMQYWCSLKAGGFAFRIGADRAQQTTSTDC